MTMGPSDRGSRRCTWQWMRCAGNKTHMIPSHSALSGEKNVGGHALTLGRSKRHLLHRSASAQGSHPAYLAPPRSPPLSHRQLMDAARRRPLGCRCIHLGPRGTARQSRAAAAAPSGCAKAARESSPLDSNPCTAPERQRQGASTGGSAGACRGKAFPSGPDGGHTSIRPRPFLFQYFSTIDFCADANVWDTSHSVATVAGGVPSWC